jgi:hypothetical protein
MRKLLRSKKGITPVLSNLLLTVIAVAGMSMAITATYVITDGLHDNMSERFIVEDVWFKDDQILFYIRNVGKVSISVDAVYIDHVSQHFTPIELEPNNHGWLIATYNWITDSAYELKVATKRGTIIVDNYMSPA